MDKNYLFTCLKYGITPDVLNYTLQEDILNDPRLNYNNYYSSPEFILQKYVPKAMIQSDYMQPVVDQIITETQKYNTLLSLSDQMDLKKSQS